MRPDDLVDTTEMYLKAVLELEEEGVIALRARVAERFDHSAPTVHQTVAKLQRDELLTVGDDRRLTFTAKGRHTADAVMRKHRLAEVFLERVIGLDWSQLHQEACRWEHVMSDRVEELLDAMLGHPEHSPYGNPISALDATDAAADNLIRLAAGRADAVHGVIRWVGEPLQVEPAQLANLSEHGIRPGARAVWALHGPAVRLRLHDAEHELELPHTVAVHIFATADTA